jgi:hypothetical protein
MCQLFSDGMLGSSLTIFAISAGKFGTSRFLVPTAEARTKRAPECADIGEEKWASRKQGRVRVSQMMESLIVEVCPKSGTREMLDHCFEGVPAEAREGVMWKNPAEIYRL